MLHSTTSEIGNINWSTIFLKGIYDIRKTRIFPKAMSFVNIVAGCWFQTGSTTINDEHARGLSVSFRSEDRLLMVTYTGMMPVGIYQKNRI